MKNSISKFHLFTVLFLFSYFISIAQPGIKWNKKNAAKWFDKQEWLRGVEAAGAAVKYDQFGRVIDTSAAISQGTSATLSNNKTKPHHSIDKVEFAKQYHANKLWWDKAFQYIRNTDLASLKTGEHPIVGDDVFARVSEGPLKNIDSSKWEAHKNYIDIHYVIRGREKIGLGSISTATLVVPYDSKRDIAFYDGKGKYYIAEPGTFFIAFLEQIHRPGLEVEGKEVEKKLVIKIKSSN